MQRCFRDARIGFRDGNTSPYRRMKDISSS